MFDIADRSEDGKLVAKLILKGILLPRCRRAPKTRRRLNMVDGVGLATVSILTIAMRRQNFSCLPRTPEPSSSSVYDSAEREVEREELLEGD